MPLNDPFFHKVECIEPSVALDLRGKADFPAFVSYKSKITICKRVYVGEEWRNLPTEFWISLNDVKDVDDKTVFQTLVNLAKLILSLPHPNAEAARIFLQLTDTDARGEVE